MKKMLDEIFTTIAVIVCLIVGWKYYQFSGLDDRLSDQCLFGGVAKIAKATDRQAFCNCYGSQVKENIGFISYFLANKTALERSMDSSYFQCRTAYRD